MIKHVLGLYLFLVLSTFSSGFAQTVISGSVSGTWTKAQSPYVLNGNVTIPTGQTLVIQPGVVVELPTNQHNINVYGTLLAQGTPTDSIRFRRPKIAPSSEYGGSFYFKAGSEASVMQYAVLDSLGDNFFGNAAINIDRPSTPTIQNVSIRNSEGYDALMWIGGAKNFSGIRSKLGIGITASAGALDAVLPKFGTGSFYRLLVDIFIDKNQKLTIEPGAVVELPTNQRNITVNGTLLAQGTPTDSIRFRRPKIAPSSEYGGSFYFKAGSEASVMQYAVLDSLGDNFFGNAAINIDRPSTPTIQNVSIRNSEGYDALMWIGGAKNFSGIRSKLGIGITASAGALDAVLPKFGTGSFYRLLVDTYIDKNQKLTIEPGAVVELPTNQRNITVNGTLLAQGTPTDSIRFRRPKIAPSSEYGGSFYFKAGSEASVMQYAVLDSLGDNFFGNAAINIDRPSTPTIQNVSIRNSEGYDALMWIGGAKNFAGIRSKLGIGITASAGALDAVLPKFGTGSFYRLLVDTYIDKDQKLTIEPGVIVELPTLNRNITVNGTLLAQGTAADSIRFRGQPHPKGNPNGEYGGGFYFKAGSEASVMQYAVLDSLGDNYFGNAAINVDRPSTPTIKNVSIRNSEGYDALMWIGGAKNFSGIRSKLGIGITASAGALDANMPKFGTGSFYRLLVDTYIDKDQKLTIEPGVIVELPTLNRNITVNGTLLAQGTAADSIRFRGQPHPKGNPNGEYGGGFYFKAGSEASVMQYAVLDSLGDNYFGNAAINVEAACTVKNTLIQNSEGIAISVNNAAILPVIQGNRFSKNPTSIRAYPGNCSNVFNNTNATILLNGGILGSNASWPFPGINSRYELSGQVQVPQGYLLTIGAGTVVDFGLQNGEIFVNGALRAIGTESAPIQLTRLQSTTASISGGRVYLSASSTSSTLNFVNLDKLGSSSLAALDVATSNFSIGNVIISAAQNRGLQLANVGSATISGSNFFNNKTGIYVISGKPVFSNCKIYANTDFGINNASTVTTDTVVARNNYWGAPTGPLHPTLNPNGKGNKVSDRVLFAPWIEQIIQVDQTISFAEILNKYVDDTLVLLNASATSALPVSFSISTQPVIGVAVLTGNTISFPGSVGQVTVTAYQPGNEYFKPVQLQRTFTVSKHNQSIAFNSIPTKTVGDAPISLTAVATSGLPVSYSVVSGPATLNGNTLTLTAAGTVVVEARQPGDRVYNPALSVQQSFVVVLPALSITNLPASATEGQTVTFKVTTNFAASSPLAVFLQSSNQTRFPVPASVTIAAGALSTDVSVNLVQDNIPEIDLAVVVTAGASNHSPATDTILVNDDDLPNLELVILASNISESAGANATQAILRRTSSSSSIAFTANLSASLPNTLLLPSSISLAQGENEKTFTIGAVDNALVDGPRLVTVTASLFVSSCGCNAPPTSSGSVSATIIVNDDDGPSLSLTVNQQTLFEGLANAGTLRITRNGPTTQALSVTLTSSDLTEATLPATAVIPVGQAFVDVPITTLDDGITDGNQTVYLTATATGLATGSTFVVVTDLNKPDLQIPLVQLISSKVQAGDDVNYQVSIKNSGGTTAPSGILVGVYLSTDNVIDASDILLSVDTLSEAIPAGQTKILAKSVKAPNTLGSYKLLFWANPNATLGELLLTNNVSAPVSLTIESSYTAIAAVGPTYFLQGNTVPITGSATRTNGSPAANVPVEVYVITQGLRRTLSDTTDASGNYSVSFVPLSREAGHYIVGASFPGLNQKTEQDGFDILGVRINKGNNIQFTATLNETLSGYVSVENLSGNSLSNFTLAPVALPGGATIQFAVLPNLAGNTSTNLGYTVNGSALTSGDNYVEAMLQAKADEGIIQRVNTLYYCQAANAYIVADVSHIQANVSQSSGERRIEIKLTNKGKAATGIITINLPNVNWLTSVTPKTLLSLAPGDTAVAVLNFIALGEIPVNSPIDGSIGINSVNGNSFSIPFTFQKVSEASGTARIVVTNQYTYLTNNGNGPKVKDALVKITNFFTGEVYAQGYTTEEGIFVGSNVPEGKHRITVEKDKHLPYEGILEINPGAITELTAFINYQAITFSWNVVPTTVQDQYETTLEATFETNVPIPVVTIEMPESMPQLSAGQEYQFMVTLTNHGLITAEEVTLNLPTTDSEYEFVTNYIPGDLLAKHSIQIPVVMRRRSGLVGGRLSAEPNAESTNGSCTDFTGVVYKYKCNSEGILERIGVLFKYKGRICPAGGICFNCHPLGGGASGEGGTINPTPVKTEKTHCLPCLSDLAAAVLGCIPGADLVALLFCDADALLDEDNEVGKGLIICLLEGGAPTGVEKVLKKLPEKIAKKLPGVQQIICVYSIGKAIYLCNKKVNSGGRVKANELPNAVLNEIAGNLQVVGDGYTALRSWMAELFGDLTDRESWPILFTLVNSYLDNQVPISASIQSNIIELMAGYDISPSELSAFFTRWNTSLEAKANNVLVPNAAYPNIINWNLVKNYVTALIQAHNYSVNKGFKTIDGMHKESINSLNEIIDGDQKGVCASVTVQFSQQLTMTREAFEGNLEIFNGHPTDAMKTISVNIQITDEAGTPSNGLFEIQPQNPASLADINAEQKGSVKFLFIPQVNAAPQTAKVYNFGGSVTYWDPYAQAMVTLPLATVPITVNPSPNLTLHYFMERNILGDDALTTPIEPSIPAELAVMVENHGYGPARDMTISSAQPKIVDNEKGLAIDFNLIASNLQGKPVQLGLTNIDFGTIEPLKTKIGQWYFTSSLLGKFVSYDAKVVHNSSFGNKDLSLIEGVKLHELTKSIRLYGALEDGITDFLVNDVFDVNDVPDIIYFSQGNRTAKVSQATSGSFNAPVSGPTFTNTLTVTPSEAGFNYIKLPDPGNKLYELASVTRSDGQVIPLNNAWLTFVTLPVLRSPIYENKFHIVDNFASTASATYTVVWKPKDLNGPKVDNITGAPTQVSSTQVKNLKVYFNKRIDPATFTYEDLTLSLQGGANIISSSVVITQLDSTSFNVDISAITTGNGLYEFTVQAATVQDLYGVSGTGGKQVSWTQFLNGISFTGLQDSYCSNATSQTLIGVPSGGTFTGPGITGNVFDPVVAGVGTHIITYSKDGKSFSDTTNVNSAPSVSISSVSTTLTCASPTLSLTALGGTSYHWEDNSTNPVRPVSTTGIYSVTVTSASGCTALASTTIVSDAGVALASISPSSATLTCASPTVSLTASGGVSYRWEDNSTNPVRPVSTTGLYSVTVTAASGCTALASATVVGGASVVLASISPSSATLTCTSPVISLTASGGGSYKWEDGSINAVRPVSTTGTYSVTVTTANGCTATASTIIGQDQNVPPAKITASSTTLSCATSTISLTASGGVSYRWEDNSVDSVRPISTTGTYSVTVTAANGCTATVRATINGDGSLPIAVISPRSTTLTCATPTVSLTASGGISYRWEDGSMNAVRPVSTTGIYSVTVTAAGGCTNVASLSVGQDLAPPTATLVASGTLSCSQNSVTLTAGGGQMYSFDGPGIITQNGSSTAIVTTAGIYSVTAVGVNGCSASQTTPVMASTTVATPNFATSSNQTVAAGLTNVIVVQNSGTVAFSATSCSGTLNWSGNGQTGTTILNAPTSATGTFVYQATCTVGTCISSPAIVTVTVNAANTAPVATTNTSQTATLGVPFAYTVNAFTDAETPTSLTYTASISPANSLSFNTTTRVLSGTPSLSGVSSVTITATDPGGLTATTSFSITVLPAPVVIDRLSVLSRDPDNGQLNTNTLKPYLQLQNDGEQGIPYSEISVRYWLTVETPAPLRFDINYAQMGNDKVHPAYVELNTPRPGATGYIEYRFDASAGSLGSHNNAVIQNSANKQDYSYFSQGDDYSYKNTGDYTLNPHITAYRNGVLIYGNEPATSGTPPLAVVLSASPTSILPTGTTTMSATVSGGQAPYTYSFSGPGTITTATNTATVSGLLAGVQTFTLVVSDATQPLSQSVSTTVSVTVTTSGPVNTAPVATPNASQTATLGMPFALTVNAFTDSETPASLTYSASISPANSLSFNTTTRVLSGTPSLSGVSSVTITATDPGGLSATTSFSITVLPAPVVIDRLSVLSRDPDNGQLNTNTLKPYLQLQNDGEQGIPYSEISVRYWLTVETPAPLRFDINYAQMGNDKVHPAYVELNTPRPGASGYIEYRFDASAGSLGSHNNAVIQNSANKQDYSYFSQGDDYSYKNTGDYTLNPHITAYRNGVLIYGNEPATSGTPPLAVVLSASPTSILPTGTTTMSATVSGGQAPYTYSFSGPGTITTATNTATVSGLLAGVQTFTLVVSDATQPLSQSVSTTVSVTVTTSGPVNTAPVATPNASQTATLGMPFALTVNAFTDSETPASLTYSASISPANSLSFNTTTRVLSGTPSLSGVSSVTITATDPGGLSATTSFSITVLPAPVVIDRLSVLSRDPDNGQLNTNTLKPYLQLQNDGEQGIPYSEISVRYWLTVETPAPLRFDINYAQMGNDKVHPAYVELNTPRPGATGYIEYRFDASAGSLGSHSNAVIQNSANKQDYSYFSQGDDYSYKNTGDYTLNPHITAYRNGVLIYGTEPQSIAGSRQETVETDVSLDVRVLSNPLLRDEIDIEVRGAANQFLHIIVTDLLGHTINDISVERAGLVERQLLPVSHQSSGILLLRVNTPTQSQTLKVLKAN